MCKLKNWISIDKLDSYSLSKNPNAIPILEKNLKKINWIALSSNPNAISILEKNQDKINWYLLSSSASIFELEIQYNKLKERCETYKEEFIEKAMHLDRIK